MTMGGTVPGGNLQPQSTPHLLVQGYYRDPVNGAVYLHKDMVEQVGPWSDAQYQSEHISPISAHQDFGDVESFAAYVKRYGVPSLTFTSWNKGGITAILDYHAEPAEDSAPGRCAWVASYPFSWSQQLTRWFGFANGSARDQRGLIEFLEDMAETVVAPSVAELTGVLSLLRASVGSKAESNLKEDGSYAVSFSKEAKLTGQGTIPSTFTIRVPLLAGHTDDEGKLVTYDLTVRLRMTPTEQGVTFRLSIPNLTVSLEDAYADRVKVAKEALGASFSLLRAAD